MELPKKKFLRDIARSRTVVQLAKARCEFWKTRVTLDYCKKKINCS
jgi:hypothetical protein